MCFGFYVWSFKSYVLVPSGTLLFLCVPTNCNTYIYLIWVEINPAQIEDTHSRFQISSLNLKVSDWRFSLLRAKSNIGWFSDGKTISEVALSHSLLSPGDGRRSLALTSSSPGWKGGTSNRLIIKLSQTNPYGAFVGYRVKRAEWMCDVERKTTLFCPYTVDHWGACSQAIRKPKTM